MKQVNTAVRNAIRSSHVIEAVPRLTAEWNMNRYFNPKADNIPSEDSDGFDVEMFPIESIVMPNRPTKGVLKARIGEGTASLGYDTQKARYYVGSVDDVYKYWTSPVQTNGSATFPLHTDGFSQVRPHVIYNDTTAINKIVVKVDNYWASPNRWFIKYTTSATPSRSDWRTAATSPEIAADGTVTLYWTGSTWTQNKPATFINPPTVAVRGLMVEVETMTTGRDRLDRPSAYRVMAGSSFENNFTTKVTDGKYSYFNLIEISGRREVDLTDRLIGVDDSFTMADVSELYPVGTITSNIANLTLSNLFVKNGVQKTGYFNKSNTASPYAGILEKNVKFNLEYLYKVNGSTYPVQQFSLYGEDWEGLVSDEVSIELTDYSKFFNEIYPRPALWQDLTVPEILQRLLDSVGFVDWVLDDETNETKHVIPNFWVDGEMNIWEILDDLAKGTQTAIFFDGFGKLKIQTRQDAFNSAKSPVWTLRGEDSATELSDIVSLEQGEELGANHLTVTYKNTTWSREVKNMPVMEKVWEPETETVVLRASPLMQSITPDSEYVQIPEADAKVWPYSGMFEIQGEIFRYNGKRFCYFTYTENVAANGTTTYTNEQRKYARVTSEDEYKEYNQKTPQPYRHKNYYTGGLVLDKENESRGVWNSESRSHSVDIDGWVVNRAKYGTAAIIENNSDGMSHNRAESSMRLRNPGNAGSNDYTVANKGNPSNDQFKFFGTQITFLKQDGLTDQRAGFIMNHTANLNNGYYVELAVSNKIANKDRAGNGEISLFTRVGGSLKKLDFTNFPVVEGVHVDLDAQIKVVGSDHRIIVWANGKKVIDKTVTGGDKNAMGGQFATYVRGKTIADFQYFYAIRREAIDPEDDASFFNLKYGGYTGSFWDREWVWGWKTVTRRKKKKQTKELKKWGLQFFDEFGPIVHEVREFDVKFDPRPVLHSRLYMSNEWTGICTEYRSDPFNAHFVLANAARENAIIQGEDSLVFGGATSTALNQVLFVLGRVLVEQEAETVEAKDESAIKIRGKVEAELESTWIQSKKMAMDIVNWMKQHWSKGVDQLEVESFGNPLLEVGDVVAIDYPDKYMQPSTHKYFVVGTNTTFDNGLTTRLSLRRVI